MQFDLYNTEMIQNLVRRDERTFNGLYDQYAGALYGILCRQVEDRCIADKLLQQTFAAAWRDIELYQPGKDTILIWLIRKCCAVTQQCMGAPLDLTRTPAIAKIS